MKGIIQKQKTLARRKKSIRKSISGSPERPRVSVYRSNKYIYAQIIDDVNHVTLVSASDLKTKGKAAKVKSAEKVGESLGALAIKKNIKKVVFDRSGYRYHGRVKALADGLRKAGLVF
ncbi:MAG: 50S ribosomal protein L18 [Candidatus Dojkabacteria bacterium]